MKPLIEDLWVNYQSEKNQKITEEEKEIMNTLNWWEESLCEGLNQEQKKLLENLTTSYSDLLFFCMKKAFADGVSFGTRYFMEAVYEEPRLPEKD